MLANNNKKLNVQKSESIRITNKSTCNQNKLLIARQEKFNSSKIIQSVWQYHYRHANPHHSFFVFLVVESTIVYNRNLDQPTSLDEFHVLKLCHDAVQ